MPLTCRTEVIGISLGGFGSWVSEKYRKGRKRVGRKGRKKVREKRVDYCRKVVWSMVRDEGSKRYRENVEGRRMISG